MVNPGKYVVDAIASAADTPRLLGVTVAKAREIADWVAGAFQETSMPRAKTARRAGAPRSARKRPAAKKAKRQANRARATAAKTMKRASRAPGSKKAAKKKTAKRAGRAAKKK